MCARRARSIGLVNAHDRLDDLHHVRGRSAAVSFAAGVCALDRAGYNNRRVGSVSDCISSHTNCRPCALHNDRAGTLGACSGDAVPSGDRRRQSHDGPCHRYFRGKHGVVFMGRRTSAKRIFLLVTARGGWLLWGFSKRRFVFVLRILRAGDRAEIFSYRCLRIHQQGIRGDEAQAIFVFVGILAAYVTAGSLDLNQLSQFQFSPQLQSWAFPVLFLGFAVLAGIWPLHTWAPTGHAAAPTAGSMLLAGIVMKLGSYAGLRVAMNLFPQGFQMWGKWIVLLGVIGIVYAAAVALRQRDLKFVIGYSSVSHMGFVMFGLAAATALSVSGAVLQMFSHGVIAALLFAVAGRMIYRRTHTRELDVLAGMNLSRALPFAAFTFVVASAASMGIPGFSGFAAEITILIGAWKTYPGAVWITGAGMVLVAAFTLRALKQSFFD